MNHTHSHLNFHSYPTASSAIFSFLKPLQIMAYWISTPSGDFFKKKQEKVTVKPNIQVTYRIAPAEPDLISDETLECVEDETLNNSRTYSLVSQLSFYAFFLLVGLGIFLLVLVLELAGNHLIHKLITLFNLAGTRKATIFVYFFESAIVSIDILLFAIYTFRITWLMILKPKI